MVCFQMKAMILRIDISAQGFRCFVQKRQKIIKMPLQIGYLLSIRMMA